MKTYLNIFFLFLILCTACGSRKASDNQAEDIKSDSTKIFALPVIPALLNTPESGSDGAGMGGLYRHHETRAGGDCYQCHQTDV